MSAEIDEILTLKSVNVFHLTYNRIESEYELNSVIKDQNFRIFREVIDGKVDSTQRELSQRLALIKCKDWFYPLEKNKTNVFRYRDKNVCYFFPDLSNPDSLSIVFIDTEVIDEIKVLLLENVLLLYCNIQDSPQEWKPIIDQLTTTPSAPVALEPEVPMETIEPEPIGAQERPQPTGMADTIAKNIVYGAELLTNGITYTTQMANNFVKRSGAQIRDNKPTSGQPKDIDPRVINGLQGLRKASHTACSVTGYAVNAVAKGTNQLGRCLAPHLKTQSKKLISSVSGKTDNESENICDNIFTVASGGLQGFATIYTGVAENAISLGKTLTTETVATVKQMYGPSAANATENAMYATGNTALAVTDVRNLGPKTIAKRVAFDTGKQVVVLDKDKDKDSNETDPKPKS